MPSVATAVGEGAGVRLSYNQYRVSCPGAAQLARLSPPESAPTLLQTHYTDFLLGSVVPLQFFCIFCQQSEILLLIAFVSVVITTN